jgi:capsular polysaccharide biosynthesis protein
MELREYYKIWRENISVVIYTIVIAAIAVYAWSMRVSQNYNASFLLDISRAENQPTSDYRYDQFYRLQADEKFAETIVEWLKTPGVAQDIFSRADIGTEQKTMRQLAKSFGAEKLSSLAIRVSFSTQTEEEAEKVAAAVSNVVSAKTENLNKEARDPNWFKVDMSNLVVLKNIQDLRINLAIAALAGLFIGTLLAFGKHYISE